MTVIGHNTIRRVENFDGYHVVAHPLPNRDYRVFGQDTTMPVTFGSHDVQIAHPTHTDGTPVKNRVAILMHHGGGRYVLDFWTGALPIASALLMLPEREQYALAYTIFKQADECEQGGRARLNRDWCQAHVDGRIRRRRANRGSVRVWIETEAEQAARQAK